MAESQGSGRSRTQSRTVGPRIPADVPWGILDGVTCLAAFVVLQAFFGTLCAVLGADETRQVCGPLPSFTCAGLMVWVLLRRWGGGQAPWNELIGLVPPTRRSFQRIWVPLGGGVAAYLLVVAATALVVERMDMRPKRQAVAEFMKATDSPVLLFLACVVVIGLAPVVEEMLFRGMLYLPLRSRLGAIPAALIVSGVFAAVHTYPLGLAQLVVLSLMFVWLFERTGTLWAPIFAHAVYNGINVINLRLGLA